MCHDFGGVGGTRSSYSNVFDICYYRLKEEADEHFLVRVERVAKSAYLTDEFDTQHPRELYSE